MEMYMGQAPKYFNKDVVYCIWCVVNLSVPCKKKKKKKLNPYPAVRDHGLILQIVLVGCIGV